MGFFDRFKKSADKKDVSSAQMTGWENMSTPETQKSNEQLNAERQQRKIIAAMALGKDGHINYGVFGENDVEMDDATRADVINSMASGEVRVSDEMKREVLLSIQSPLKEPGYRYRGPNSALKDVDDARMTSEALKIVSGMSEHELKILSSMTDLGFGGWKRCAPDTVLSFAERYPTPMDFEEISGRFLNVIERDNGAFKRAEYEESMRDFKRRVYGKRLEYWEQMKNIDQEVSERRRQIEAERSAEWIPGEACAWQTSRSQAYNGLVSRDNIERGLWADSSCEDSFFSRPETQTYGVFDGAGGMGNGRLASRVASGVFREYCDGNRISDSETLADALNEASSRVYDEPGIGEGCSTGVVASVIERDGVVKLAYASMGDSRIYIVDRNGNARMITKDEGFGKYIDNAIGGNHKKGIVGRCKQHGEEDLHTGDCVVICSDGITGDEGDDLMSEAELGSIVHHSHGVTDASKNLIARARKFDDRTALVFVPRFE